ncbi:MAG TPA: hypothetical protein VJZ68_00360 [Nitrososphaera sp.]|nr:hypothetical protein [Nitrososphaera sp.]
MSEKPEERSRDSKKVAEDNIEQPVDKQAPTEPVQVGGAKEDKGTSALWVQSFSRRIIRILLLSK